MEQLPTPPSPSKSVVPPKPPLAFWILREFASITVWFLAPVKVFIYDFDERILQAIAPSYLWVLDFKVFIIGTFVLVAIASIPKKRFRWTAFYILGYPIVLLWRISKLAFRNPLGTMIVLPSVIEFFRKIKSTFVLWFFAMFCFVIIVFSNNPIFLTVASGYLFFILGRNFWRQGQIAYGGENIYGYLNKQIKKHWKTDDVIEKITKSESDPA